MVNPSHNPELWGPIPRVTPDNGRDEYINPLDYVEILKSAEIFETGGGKLISQIQPLGRNVLEQLITANGNTADLLRLNGFDMTGIDIRGLDLRRAYLQRANLTWAIAKPLIVSHGEPYTPDDLATDAVYEDWMIGDNAYNVEIYPTLFGRILGNQAQFIRADLRYANFNKAIMPWADFTEAGIAYSTFNEAVLTNVKLVDTKCFRADFSESRFESVLTFRADLRDCNFRMADLSGTMFDTTFISGIRWMDDDD